MSKVSGVIEAYSNKFDKFSILVNDTWYSSKFEIKAQKGDTVEFDDGGKKWCQKLRVIASGGSSHIGEGASAKPTNAGRDRAIIRQNALGHATALVVAGNYDDIDEAANKVIELARKFEAYSSGDEDVPVGPQYDTDGDFVM